MNNPLVLCGFIALLIIQSMRFNKAKARLNAANTEIDNQQRILRMAYESYNRQANKLQEEIEQLKSRV